MANLLVNGGFDNPTLAPWDVSGITVIGNANIDVGDYYNSIGTGPVLPPSPSQSLEVNVLLAGLGAIFQNVTLIPGAKYRLQFAIKQAALLGVNILSVSVPGTTLVDIGISLNLLSTGTWYTYDVEFTSLTTSTQVIFTFTTLVTGATNIDAVALYQITAPCYSWKSMVRTKNINTGEIKDLMVKDVYSDEHMVYRTDLGQYVPIVYNAKTGTTRRYVKFAKDVLGPNKPTEDLYITSGHRLRVDGYSVKAGDIKGGVRCKADDDQLYTISTPEACPIWINGLDVMSYSEERFLKYCEANKIKWSDNKRPDKTSESATINL